jgi:uncharacterized membrane protein
MKPKMKNETLIWVIVIVAVFFFVSSGFGYGGYGGMMGMMYGSYGGGMMFFSWLHGILILVALVLFIFWLVQQIQKK